VLSVWFLLIFLIRGSFFYDERFCFLLLFLYWIRLRPWCALVCHVVVVVLFVWFRRRAINYWKQSYAEMVLLLLLRWKKEKKRCNKWHSCFFEKFEKYKDVEKNQHKCFPEIIFTSKKIAGIVLFFLPRTQQQQQHLCNKKKQNNRQIIFAHTCRI